MKQRALLLIKLLVDLLKRSKVLEEYDILRGPYLTSKYQEKQNFKCLFLSIMFLFCALLLPNE